METYTYGLNRNVIGEAVKEHSCWVSQPTGGLQLHHSASAQSVSMCSCQTLASFGDTTSSISEVAELQSYSDKSFLSGTIGVSGACSEEFTLPAPEQALERWLEPTGPAAAYAACAEMVRRHKLCEQLYVDQLASIAEGTCGVDEGSRMIVVSWLVEVAEEFGLQQETLHASVAMLDRFLSTSNGVPGCVLQLVAVGCMFLASKQLEVHHPSVEQMVAIAAHSFTAADLLRVERVLLDALEFNITLPTPYSFLHLLTQATLAAQSCCSSMHQLPADLAAAVAAATTVPGPGMEAVVSLAMYITELSLLDRSCLMFPGSTIATAALLLSHATLSGHCNAWELVLHAADMTVDDVAAAVALLRKLHAAAAAPPSSEIAELLQPLDIKFGQDCWCRVAKDVTPLDMQQQQQQC